MPAATVIKKYGNRRLYDTGDSRYVTLEELAAKIKGGVDVRVTDAQTGEDLTQATLAQIIFEGGSAARLLPVNLLMQLVRLDDDALAEFFSRYVSGALDMYVQAKRVAQPLTQLNPFAQLPAWLGFGGYGAPQPPPAYYAPPPQASRPPTEPPPDDDDRSDRRRDDDIAALRRELDELKRAGGLGKPGAPRRKKRS
jgi:polyhydroxyalkanoate synthesis repressor PhaR